jgi:hypothetical protein
MKIPIVINNLNRLSTTKQLVKDLQKRDYFDITILDNGSTYKPLLDWYDTNKEIKVKRLNNLGQLAIYNSGLLNDLRLEKNDWVVYTDSDIELNLNTPKDFIEQMILIGEKYNYSKVGLSLDIKNLPITELGNEIFTWETKFWKECLAENIYKADVDTTFCVIRTDKSFQYEALRVAGDFTCKHLPWYTDFSNLNEEEKYYLDNVSLEYSGYKRYYNRFLKEYK